MTKVYDWTVGFWRGEVPLLQAVLLPLIGLHLLLVAILRRFAPEQTLWAIVALLLITLWQVTGTFRSADSALRSGSDRLSVSAAYAACIAVTCLALAQAVSLWSAPHVPPLQSRQTLMQANGLTFEADQVSLKGPITLRQFYALEKHLAGGATPALITLDSPGGAVHAARGLARLIASTGLAAHVTGKCFSACTLVLMASDSRSMAQGAEIGFHKYSPGTYSNLGHLELEDATRAEDRDHHFFRNRGLSEAFVNRIFATPHIDLWRPDRAALRAEGVLTE